MNFRRFNLLALGILLSAPGCMSDPFGGLFKPPGSVEAQRDRAVRFDPYPENDIGPHVDGGRPPGYQNPLPEVSRSRWTLGQ